MIIRPKRQKQVIIDRQILALHQAMADKLLANPALFLQVEENLTERLRSGMLSYGSGLLWQGILELKGNPDAFRAALLATDKRTASLRRQTILSGVLSEQERAEALAAYAASELA